MEPKRFFSTSSGIEIKPVYSKENISILSEIPGVFPFTRGIHPDMYRSRLWTMRQYSGFSTPEESNKRYHYLLKNGISGLSVAFDLPTQMGYDSDHSLAEGEVGKSGVAIDSLADIELLFKGIRLEGVTTSMTINSTAAILLALYIALAKKQGADLKKISGTVQNDILKEYAARGTFIYPPRPSMRLVSDIIEYCSNEVPRWNTISISGYHMREAGCTAAQEIAFTLANGKEYVKSAMDRGLDINLFGQRLSFFFNAHNNFFEEIAKFRAARRMWAKIIKEAGATDPRAQMLRFHTQTGGSTLTAQQPLNNIVRVTMQALAAVLGGTQSLHTNSYDEAMGLPTEEAVLIALRTQQIIAHESGAPDTVDPTGGGYYIEHLTEELEKKASEYLSRIDKLGGSVAAIEQGYIQNEISGSAYEYQREIEEGKRIIVGVNKYAEEEKNTGTIFRVDESIRKKQIRKLSKLRANRDGNKVKKSLRDIENTARSGGNMMPFILTACENYCTLGEISDAMRRVFGEFKG
ncbi:MAG: methylmalonyl-CoA mutase [Bacteroidetes bacterium]|nr:methylmalonyl-CoA mutase [Bacteroidota bacterium]